ncbi:hypothetical protein [Streptomyces sp. NPDC005799]|uniref:hypothetical protein n=1 Tax=Streptomyces sp. NPDC005799 TaxID=3154678 RepID=UPI0033EE8F61
MPGRTHNCRSTGSPGATVTSACPATQPAAEADALGDAGRLPEGLAGGVGEGLAGAVDDGPADGLAGGPDERPGDGEADPPPPPVDPPHATSATTPAATHTPAHHRIPHLPVRAYGHQDAPDSVRWCLAGGERGLPLIVSVVVAAQTALHEAFPLARSATGTAGSTTAMDMSGMGSMDMSTMGHEHDGRGADARHVPYRGRLTGAGFERGRPGRRAPGEKTIGPTPSGIMLML